MGVQPITIRISRRKLRAWKMLFCGLLLLLLLILLDGQIRPIITTVTDYQAKLAVTRSINEAVLEVISEEQVSYNNIIKMTTAPDGEVTSLHTDMVAMNRLKAEVSNRVADRLEADAGQPVQIPIGSLLGNQYFAGRGPELCFQVLPAEYVITDFYNEFRSAGINQTLHQIMLTVTAKVGAVMPPYTVETEVKTDICIAETVIVGRVPESFTDINGDDRGMIDKVNDYGAARS